MQGELDEAAEAAAFKEAVQAWREGRQAPSACQTGINSCALPTPPTVTQTATDLVVAKTCQKKCCYHCYRQFFAYCEDGLENISSAAQKFCSDACAAKAEDA